MNICFQICLSWIYFDFWAKFFLLGNAEFTKRPLLREQTGVVNNLSSTKLSYSKWKNAVLNPSKSFLAFKKVNPRVLSTFKRSFSKKKGKTLSSYIMHLLGGECCWTVRDSQLIRLLKSPRWLSVYTAISREVVGKNVHATIPKGSMGYDQYFCCCPLALTDICPWRLLPFFQISLKNSELKNNPQCLSGLSRALYPTTFLKIPVY